MAVGDKTDLFFRKLRSAGLSRPAVEALLANFASVGARTVKVPITASTPHVFDGQLTALTLQPGEMLLGGVVATREGFGTTYLSSVAAASAPALPLTIDDTNELYNANYDGWTIAHGTYTTAADLAAALNGAIQGASGKRFDASAPSEGGTWSVVDGKLVVTAANVNNTAQVANEPNNIDIGLLGFTQPLDAGGVADLAVASYAYVWDTTTDPDNALFSAATYGLDNRVGALWTPATGFGILAQATALGYVGPDDDPVTLKMAVLDASGRAAASSLPSIHSDGTGQALVWFWIVDLFSAA